MILVILDTKIYLAVILVKKKKKVGDVGFLLVCVTS